MHELLELELLDELLDESDEEDDDEDSELELDSSSGNSGVGVIGGEPTIESSV